MIIKNKNILGSAISIIDDQVEITSKDLVLREKIESLLIVVDKANWEKKVYLKFIKQLAKCELMVFNDVYDEMINLLVLPLDEVEKRLIYLDSKLNLHLFDSKRCMKSVKEINPITNEIVMVQKLTFIPYEFSAADIILFFQKLNSKINQHSHIIINTYWEKIMVCKTADDQEAEIKLLIDLLSQRDSKLCAIIEKEYFSWINALSEDDCIYRYLNGKFSNVIDNNERELKVKLSNYKMKEIDVYRNEENKKILAKRAKLN